MTSDFFENGPYLVYPKIHPPQGPLRDPGEVKIVLSFIASLHILIPNFIIPKERHH